LIPVKSVANNPIDLAVQPAWLLPDKPHTTMIIWKGLGILVPLIAIVGIVVGTVLASAFGFAEMGLGLGLALAAIGNWFLWKKVNSRPGKVLVDPQTGQEVMLKPSHSLFFIPAGFWTWPMGLFAIILMIGAPAAKESSEREAATPGYKEFEAANKLIGSNSNGNIHGNTDAAKQAAQGFSTMMKTMTSMAFTGGSKKNLMTGGDFLTYCHDNGDTIVFLCHVPSLRSYKTEETKSALADIAWAAGMAAIEEIDPEKKKTLMVGLRGISAYGCIQQGASSEETKPNKLDTSARSVFYPAFAPVAALPES